MVMGIQAREERGGGGVKLRFNAHLFRTSNMFHKNA